MCSSCSSRSSPVSKLQKELARATEKAALVKELNDKSTVLAGVKEKTKMYVDRLNVDHAATLAALQTQVDDRDGRLVKAEALLRAKLAAKDQELEAAKAEADTLRAAALETKEGAGHSLPEANGDGAEAGPESGTGDGTGVGKAEMEALKEELQRLVEALKVSEASRVGVENLLAEAKQAAHAAEERRLEEEASSRIAQEEIAVELAKNRREAAAELEWEKAAVRSLQTRLDDERASAAAAAAEKAAAHTSALEELRSRLAAGEASAAESMAAARATAAAVAAAEAVAAGDRAGEARAEATKQDAMAKALAAAKAEVARLREDLEQAREDAEAAAAANAKKEGGGGGCNRPTEGGADDEPPPGGEPTTRTTEVDALCRRLAKETEKSREQARNQAEELSSRLMEALEEREEGRRREEGVARKVAELEAGLEKTSAELEGVRVELEEVRGEAAAAVVGSAESATEWALKVKEAEEKTKAAEETSVALIKSLEEALTQARGERNCGGGGGGALYKCRHVVEDKQLGVGVMNLAREQEAERLKKEAAGLRREASLPKAELEARGEALRQAKLDLASAVEEADAAAKMAAEARSKLEKVEAEHGETKMRLQSECAANEGLKAAVMEANETVSKRVDGMREANEKMEAERDAATTEAAEGRTQLQALQAQVASLLRENAGAKTSAGLRVGDLQQRLSAAQNELARERESIAERKKEMQAYADAMAKEGEALRAATQEAQAAAAHAAMSEREARSSVGQARQQREATALSLRQALDKQRAEAAIAMDALQERNEALEAETSRLQRLMTLETGQNEEKAQGLEQSLLGKIEEANLHKKKRLAARSEMISLAKALETERDGHKAMGHALQYSLMPKAIDQATVLERVVMMAERSLHSLSRASGVRLASSLQAAQASLARLRGRVAGADDPHIAYHQQQTSDLSRVALMGGVGMGLPEDASSSVISDRMDSPLSSAASSDHAGSGFWPGANRGVTGRLGNQAAKDSVYLDRVRRLESEMDRVSSGLALVSQSVEQLAELVQVQASLCGGFSVICCPSRRISHGVARTRTSGAAGGPAYTTLEMGSRRVVEDDENVGPGV
eukprot:jgi/Undpi1/12277/HiC_scaffold_5.g01953.m1